MRAHLRTQCGCAQCFCSGFGSWHRHAMMGWSLVPLQRVLPCRLETTHRRHRMPSCRCLVSMLLCCTSGRWLPWHSALGGGAGFASFCVLAVARLPSGARYVRSGCFVAAARMPRCTEQCPCSVSGDIACVSLRAHCLHVRRFLAAMRRAIASMLRLCANNRRCRLEVLHGWRCVRGRCLAKLTGRVCLQVACTCKPVVLGALCVARRTSP